MVLLLPLILTLFIGCIKAKEEPGKLGAEVPPEKIDRALSEAIEGADLSNISVGQFVEYALIRRIENEETTINLGGTRITVREREETDDQVRFMLHIKKTERINSTEFEERESEETLVLSKVSGDVVTQSSESPRVQPLTAPSVEDLIAYAKGSQVTPSATPTRITFHNLRKSSGTIEPPEKVRHKADCGGLSPCALPVKFVQFDMVQWYDSGSYQKYSLDFAFSVATPFIPFGARDSFDQLSGLLVIDCRSTYVHVDNRTVYVRDCYNLEDFQK